MVVAGLVGAEGTFVAGVVGAGALAAGPFGGADAPFVEGTPGTGLLPDSGVTGGVAGVVGRAAGLRSTSRAGDGGLSGRP